MPIESKTLNEAEARIEFVQDTFRGITFLASLSTANLISFSRVCCPMQCHVNLNWFSIKIDSLFIESFLSRVKVKLEGRNRSNALKLCRLSPKEFFNASVLTQSLRASLLCFVGNTTEAKNWIAYKRHCSITKRVFIRVFNSSAFPVVILLGFFVALSEEKVRKINFFQWIKPGKEIRQTEKETS